MSALHVGLMLFGVAFVIGLLGIMTKAGDAAPPLECRCSCEGETAVLEVVTMEDTDG